jgi:hypothetical protein
MKDISGSGTFAKIEILGNGKLLGGFWKLERPQGSSVWYA